MSTWEKLRWTIAIVLVVLADLIDPAGDR